MQTNKDDFKVLSDQFSKSYAKFQSLKANGMGNDSEDKTSQIYNEMDGMFRYLTQEINYLYSTMEKYISEHNKNHVPALNSPSAMEKFLASVGMENDYEVTKPKITVKANRNSRTLEIG